MSGICTGACIFGKCPNKVCVRYKNRDGEAKQINIKSNVLTKLDIEQLISDEDGCGIAVDIGTTTCVAYLYDLKTAECLSVKSAMNPQITLGVDVISRINFCKENEDGLSRMQNAVVTLLNRFIADMQAETGVRTSDIKKAVITGNTTMLHLLYGLSPVSMGELPFEPESYFDIDIKGRDIGLDIKDADIYLVQCVSAFVGGDIVSSVIASGMHKSEKISLLVDLGTNGEIVIGNKEHFVVSSTAAGPAFEGSHIKCGMAGVEGAVSKVYIFDGKIEYSMIGEGSPKGLCGSGILDLIAVAVKIGLIEDTGNIPDADEVPDAVKRYIRDIDGENAVYIDENVYITQSDVRQFQTAKAAVAAGIRCLISQGGYTSMDIDTVYIAGGFGNYMSTQSAIDVGLLDKGFLSKIKCIGNAAGSGAVMTLFDKSKREECRMIKGMSEHLELGGNIEFVDNYVECMMF